MKKIMIISFILVLVLSMSVAAEEEVEYFEPNFRVGAGYIVIPNASGFLIEGTFALSPQTDFFFGMVPLEDDGVIFKAGGMDYKFRVEEEDGIEPGIGIIVVANEGFSPTVSINLSDPENEELNFVFRGGYNVFSGSVQFSF